MYTFRLYLERCLGLVAAGFGVLWREGQQDHVNQARLDLYLQFVQQVPKTVTHVRLVFYLGMLRTCDFHRVWCRLEWRTLRKALNRMPHLEELELVLVGANAARIWEEVYAFENLETVAQRDFESMSEFS